MLDNEGTELENESGESTEASSEPASSESSESGSDNKQNLSSGDENKQEDTSSLPFHEHPRFKELIEQKNQEIAARKSLEEKLSQMEARFNQAPKEKTPTQDAKDDLIEDLKKIDPRLAARLEKFTQSLSTVESVQSKLQAYEQAQNRASAVQQINSLHETNKVSPELKELINNRLELMAQSGQIQSLDQIPNLYKNTYDQYKKFGDGIERTTRESYVKAKTADSKIPTSQPKGKPANSSPKSQPFSKDPEVARQQVVSRYLKMAKAEADL